jgi:hypothetical protein
MDTGVFFLLNKAESSSVNVLIIQVIERKMNTERCDEKILPLISLSMALLLFVRLWQLCQFLNPIHSR